MNILSYRGPGSPGGVSATLSRLFKITGISNAQWCYVSGNSLHRIETHRRGPSARCHIPQTIVDGHYRYCNEFLWPVLHDLPQDSTYIAADRLLYNQFNLASTSIIAKTPKADIINNWFVNDYQFALLPELLSSSGLAITTFWHIPWPRNVQPNHIEPLKEIALGLLGSRKIGFHTQEYADNFLNFVQEHCHQYRVDILKMNIVMGNERESYGHNRFNQKKTSILVRPLGIDTQYWKYLAENQPTPSAKEQEEEEGLAVGDLHAPTYTLSHSRTNVSHSDKLLIAKPYILSVDRCDYTKGISQRLQGIDTFFETFPQYRNQVNFIQICQPSRQGLKVFNDYWLQCSKQAETINNKWQDCDWKPIYWIDTPVSAQTLSLFYRRATAMLITPIRDGLNLTAKEYIACTDHNPGVLLLSYATGAWQEIGPYSLTINPHDDQQIAIQIDRALVMPPAERLNRASKIKELLEHNSLATWTKLFNTPRKRIPAIIAPIKEKHAAV
ncbi:MAG: Trehalose-6-phosphate synthase [Cyanobacteriota bacterium erpe_2018_sw_39hr_WHONDRS-SW48-000098_B_bin.30]|nr:Trehalose-6-phosphate synthase [Cyanobacteriota bacterium erpe_2018_sw_39hr_WHONDRS-SW48-000098_B_bin.30]